MKSSVRFSLVLLIAPLALVATPVTATAQFQLQSSFSSSLNNLAIQPFLAAEPASFGGGSTRVGSGITSAPDSMRPFSHVALGVGVSPLGIDLQATTNINRHFNLRETGSFFKYTADNISTQGFNVTAKINLASARTSLDYYPFHKGFRLSPGLLYYNGNQANVTFVAAAGTSFSLNDHTYYSASGANAVLGTGSFGLGNGKPAFTLTTGWGNVIPASGRHFSFPVEVGVAFIKEPTVSLLLTGEVCDAQGQNCVNVATDPTAQADLAVQLQKYQNDADPLKTYPIVSFGVAYNFNVRPAHAY